MSIIKIEQILFDNNIGVANHCTYTYVVENYKYLKGIDKELLSICKVLSIKNIHYWEIQKTVDAIKQEKINIFDRLLRRGT